MEYYWENTLLKRTVNHRDRKDPREKLVFLPNLKQFIINNPEIDFDGTSLFCKKDFAGTLTCYSITNRDKTIEWRQIQDIETLEDFQEWYELLSLDKKRWSPDFMKYNIPHMSELWMKNKFSYYEVNREGEKKKKNRLSPPLRDLCYNDEKLFRALNSCYLNGYSHVSCKEKVVYEDCYFFDKSSNHSAIMYYFDFPKRFIHLNREDWGQVKGKHYFGYFKLIFKFHHPYLSNFKNQYGGTVGTFEGWINDIDMEFFRELVGIEKTICDDLYLVEVDKLPDDLRQAIRYLYGCKEAASCPNPTSLQKKARALYKNCLEKLYGNSCKKRYPLIETKLDEKQRKFVDYPRVDDWKFIQPCLLNPYHKYRWDLSVGIWTCSYARLQGLKIEKALERAGAKHLYTDIDSHIFQGKEGLKVIEAFNQSFQLKEIGLGKFKSELVNEKGETITGDFKTDGLKWYIIRDIEKKLTIKCAGADKKIVKDYLETLEDPVKSFSKSFPPHIKPFKGQVFKEHKMEYEWYSEMEAS